MDLGAERCFPKILEHKKFGEQATELYNEAQKMLKDIIENKRFRLRAVYGFWPANSTGEDVKIYDIDDPDKQVETAFYFLRQQKQKVSDDETYYNLADFVAPEDCGKRDYIGGFAVTAGMEEDYANGFKENGDDYTAILIQALGDRFAEALAEYIHKEVRDEWGIGEQDGFGYDEIPNDDQVQAMIKEKYQGIRPAAGYPSCPEHTEKETLWEIVECRGEHYDQFNDKLCNESTEFCV